MAGVEQHPRINVFSKDLLVGFLIFDQPRTCQFYYADSWVEKGYPISPNLPLTGHFESDTAINFMRNLFPEGEAFNLLLESAKVSRNNIYIILKTIGLDTAGALTFTELDHVAQTTQLRPVSDEELADRLDRQIDLTHWDGKFRLSIAGVQRKLNLYLDNKNSAYLADGVFASTHILKFSSSEFPSVVINELFCMKLAAAIGLSVASVSHKKIGSHSALLVERFDRRISAQGVDKRHLIDGCQALDLPPEYKYEQSFGSGMDVAHIRDGASLSKLFEFASTSSIPAVTIKCLTDWMLFNLIIGNSDAHGKNISFFVNKNGTSLAPFYDLVSVIFEASQQERLNTDLAMAIGDNFDINKITAFDLLSLADDVNLRFELLKRRLHRVANACRNSAPILDFSDQNLSIDQLKKMDELRQLIDARCTAMLDQGRQFKNVIDSVFR